MKDSFTTSQSHWLDVAERVAIVGSLGGSVVGVFLKQFLWATIPLSTAAGLALLNHQRLKNLIAAEQEAIASLIAQSEVKVDDLKAEFNQDYQANQLKFAELEAELAQVRNLATTELARLQQETKTEFSATGQEIEVLQGSFTRLDSLSQQLEQNLQTVASKQKETGKLVRELKAIDIFTHNIKAEFNVVQSYYERGFAYQRLGNKHRAVEDYTRTIELDINHAQAHHNRGVLYADMNLNQKAAIDLRRASQLYFDKGNLDKYRETKELCQKILQSQPEEIIAVEDQQVQDAEAEAVIVGNLFG